MPKSKIILALGIFIALLPVLGFPQSWESFFEVAAGLSIVLFSLLISVDRRLSLKARVQKRQARKKALSSDTGEPVFGRRAIDVEPPPTVVPPRATPVPAGRTRVGRRATDVVIPVPEPEVQPSSVESNTQ
jgi:hypothetical protein